MENGALLEQRIKNLEESLKNVQDEVKELNKRVAGHDTSIAKIELLVEGLQRQWLALEQHIRQVIEAQNSQDTNTSAWKEVTIEAIKTIGLVASAILAAKIFIGQ